MRFSLLPLKGITNLFLLLFLIPVQLIFRFTDQGGPTLLQGYALEMYRKQRPLFGPA